ncbi:hypothetical protein KY342_03465 [Candidatus Woesearchaeota archaeon]|nr:hypothetical protein [Candidatus Woesearchaeota archaeon]
MSQLEDFCQEIANELNIQLQTQDNSPEEIIKSGKLNKLSISYQRVTFEAHPPKDILEKGPYTEFLTVRTHEQDIINEIELGIIKYFKDDNLVLRIGLPSLYYTAYLNRLDNKPLSLLFKEQFSKRDPERADDNTTFLEYTKIKDLKQAKDLIYKLFLIKMTYEEVAEEINSLIKRPNYNNGQEIIVALEDFYHDIPDQQGREHLLKYTKERLKTENNQNIKEILEEVCKEIP